MTGFERESSGVGSDHSDNFSPTTAHLYKTHLHDNFFPVSGMQLTAEMKASNGQCQNK